MTKELKMSCTIYLDMREGETKEEATERLTSLLDSELTNLADHKIAYQVWDAKAEAV